MIQRTMASKEDLRALATKAELQVVKDNLRDFRKGMGGFQKDMREFKQATAEQFMSLHEDVAYARNATGMVVRSDAGQDKDIDRLKDRVHRLEQKAGFAM